MGMGSFAKAEAKAFGIFQKSVWGGLHSVLTGDAELGAARAISGTHNYFKGPGLSTASRALRYSYPLATNAIGAAAIYGALSTTNLSTQHKQMITGVSSGLSLISAYNTLRRL